MKLRLVTSYCHLVKLDKVTLKRPIGELTILNGVVQLINYGVCT